MIKSNNSENSSTNKNNQVKYKFIANTWIYGIYNNLEVIGRTCIIDEIESLCIVDSKANSLIINFQDIKNPFIVSVNSKQTNPITIDENLIENEIDLTSILAKQNKHSN